MMAMLNELSRRRRRLLSSWNVRLLLDEPRIDIENARVFEI
jgi:hypothetical protein